MTSERSAEQLSDQGRILAKPVVLETPAAGLMAELVHFL